jgi:hypothetical protein
MVKRREECNTYLFRREPGEKIKYEIELSAKTVAFNSCRRRVPGEKIKYKIELSSAVDVYS